MGQRDGAVQLRDVDRPADLLVAVSDSGELV
jgi:hypothetical protein